VPAQTIIRSASNPLIKDVRRAVERGTLTEEGFWVAETFHLLEEALRSDRQVETVLAAEPVRSAVEAHVRGLPGVRLIVAPEEIIRRASGTESSQGVIALVRPPAWELPQLFRGKSLIVVLDGVQDPGNAGAIVRTAEAFGATGVMFLKGTASPYNPKTLRASAGSLFRMPFAHALETPLALAALKQNRVEMYAAMPASRDGAKPLDKIDLGRKCALVIGNEARGVSEALRAAAGSVSIPTVAVESLNAGVAAAILLYEARRQRSL